MPLGFAAVTPHPPIIVSGVGTKTDQQRCRQTITAMKKLALLLAEYRPETIVIVSPHAPLDPEFFAINVSKKLTIALDQFGASFSSSEAGTDQDLLNRFEAALKKTTDLPYVKIESPQLDHGTVVPLSFFATILKRTKILSLSYSLLPLAAHVRYGEILYRAVESSPRRVAIIASGDLSHCLTANAPGGFAPEAKAFDQQLVKIIAAADWASLEKIDPALTEAAGECGLRSFMILSGALSAKNVQPEVLSYEGPFGVGYLVANFKF